MSKSYKKNAFIKDYNPDFKKIRRKKFRRKTKECNKEVLKNEEVIYPEDYSELINDYKVCDWRTKIKKSKKYNKKCGCRIKNNKVLK